jgi:hypothetical protein
MGGFTPVAFLAMNRYIGEALPECMANRDLLTPKPEQYSSRLQNQKDRGKWKEWEKLGLRVDAIMCSVLFCYWSDE